MSKKILVTGATGQQGGSIVDALLDAGHEIPKVTGRAFSRFVESKLRRATSPIGRAWRKPLRVSTAHS